MTRSETSHGVSATSPLRLWGYGVVLAAIAFVQSPGLMVGDTKFDLVVDPWGFLGRAAHMWDSQAAFGQVQNQAYGYFWPMGPFFGVGHTVHVPEWVVQRLWWTLLLCLAFFGILRLCRAMGVGRPWTQVVAAFAFALSPHLVTLLGATSVEAWPTALAPWVLVPLVRATQGGSVRRQAALSALVVACCGGVNAVAVSAVLPLGALWIWTRSAGPRRWRLFAWWVGCVVLATLWWLVPLLLMGGYAAPFLDYIESAPITTLPTGLVNTVNGVSDWVAYAAPDTFPAGHQVATTAFLVLDAAVVAGLGLAGIARRDNEHRRFLLAGVVVGAVLVGFGYAGDMHGWFAHPRQDLLDAALAPFRNLHKYDVVLRIPLVLGLAHLLERLQGAASAPEAHPHASSSSRIPASVALLTAMVAMLGLSVPWYSGVVAPRGGVLEVPDYWRAAAQYLTKEDDGTVALEVPASAFGDYLWGRPHDDILQSLAGSPWAVRNVVPLAEPGNVVFLDAVTEAVEAGRPNSALADVLAANGIGRLVVRNDLDRLVTGAPEPVVLHQALSLSQGLERAATFGPPVGEPALTHAPNGTRVLTRAGLSARYPAIEVYDVQPPAGRALLVSGDVPAVVGDPGSLLRAPGFDALPYSSPTVLAGDLGDRTLPLLLTDGLRYREKTFAEVRRNESATHPPVTDWLLPAVVPNHQIYDDQRRWSTTAAVQGVEGVEATSSQSDATSAPPLAREHLPFAALDGSVATSWRSALGTAPQGQTWRVAFGSPQPVPVVSVTMGRSTGRVVRQLTFRSGGHEKTVGAPAPGRTRNVWLGWPASDDLSVTATKAAAHGQFSLAEVSVPGVSARRYLQLPVPPAGDDVSAVVLTRDQGVSSCVRLVDLVCDDRVGTGGEDGDWLNRIVTLDAPQEYAVQLHGSARTGRAAVSALRNLLPVRATASSRIGREVGQSALATVDGDPATTWVSSPRDATPWLRVSWRAPVTVRSLRLAVDDAAGASQPRKVLLVWGKGPDQSRTVKLDRSGAATIPAVRAKKLTMVIQSWDAAYSVDGEQAFPLPPGVSELELDGGDDLTGQQADQPLVVPCAAGPQVIAGDADLRTRARTTLQQVMSGGSVSLLPCGQDRVRLDSGRNLVTVVPSTLLRADAMLLDRPGSPGLPTVVRPSISSWGQDRRTVDLPDRSGESLLVVEENENAGWHATLDGKALQSQRVDGWKQGWWVPAGDAAQVELSYSPQGPYRTALAAGLAGALVVVALALWRRRDRSEELPALRPAEGWTVLDGLLLVGAAGLLAGFVGAAVALACVAATLLVPGPRDWVGPAAGLLVLAGGAVVAHGWSQGITIQSGPGQVLVVGALCLSFLALANGPLFFRRRAGRSSQ